MRSRAPPVRGLCCARRRSTRQNVAVCSTPPMQTRSVQSGTKRPRRDAIRLRGRQAPTRKIRREARHARHDGPQNPERLASQLRSSTTTVSPAEKRRDHGPGRVSKPGTCHSPQCPATGVGATRRSRALQSAPRCSSRLIVAASRMPQPHSALRDLALRTTGPLRAGHHSAGRAPRYTRRSSQPHAAPAHKGPMSRSEFDWISPTQPASGAAPGLAEMGRAALTSHSKW